MAKRTKPAPLPSPTMGDHVQRIQDMGLSVMSYHNRAQDGYWVPRDVAGKDLALILWRDVRDGKASDFRGV